MTVTTPLILVARPGAGAVAVAYAQGHCNEGVRRAPRTGRDTVRAMDLMYTAVATARGGREGEVVSDDGVLDLLLSMPKEMGGPGGDFTNPEQLFAAGYSACFHSAIKRVASGEKLDVTGSSITAHVGLGKDGTAVGLAVTLVGAFPALSAPEGQELMEKAHQMCPYSRATQGNIEVTLTVG